MNASANIHKNTFEEVKRKKKVEIPVYSRFKH